MNNIVIAIMAVALITYFFRVLPLIKENFLGIFEERFKNSLEVLSFCIILFLFIILFFDNVEKYNSLVLIFTLILSYAIFKFSKNIGVSIIFSVLVFVIFQII